MSPEKYNEYRRYILAAQMFISYGVPCSTSDDETVTSLERLADSHLQAWEDELYNSDRRQELEVAQG